MDEPDGQMVGFRDEPVVRFRFNVESEWSDGCFQKGELDDSDGQMVSQSD